MIVYYIIVVVRYITSISYNTNTGNTLCNAPDDLFDLWSLSLLSYYPNNSNCDNRNILHLLSESIVVVVG